MMVELGLSLNVQILSSVTPKIDIVTVVSSLLPHFPFHSINNSFSSLIRFSLSSTAAKNKS